MYILESREETLMLFRQKNARHIKGSMCPSIICVLVNQVGGEELETLCIRVGYSEPNRSESWEGSPTLAESSRVILGDVTLSSDWLAKFEDSFVIDSDWLSTTISGKKPSGLGALLK